MQAYVVLMLTVVACKSESKPAPAKEPATTQEPSKEQIHEIAKQPRTAIAGKTGFLEFTIDLPDTASRPLKGDRATTVTFKDSKLQLEVTELGELPSQSTMKGGAAPNIDSKIERTLTEEAGGYLVVDRKADATNFRVEYCRDLDPAEPPSGICCRATLASATPLVDIDKLITFGEQLCRSIEVQNRKVPPPAGSAAK